METIASALIAARQEGREDAKSIIKLVPVAASRKPLIMNEEWLQAWGQGVEDCKQAILNSHGWDAVAIRALRP